MSYSQGDYTYAGFEPTSLTRNMDTTDPAKGGKDWVYRYLRENNVQPTNDWAGGAAAALNQKHGTNVFRQIDGETLGWGDEYAHSAANGYGLKGGQYDPNAKGEFFWGATGDGSQSGGGGQQQGSGQPNFNMDAIKRLLQEMQQGGGASPFQMAGQGGGTNPFMDWLKTESSKSGGQPQLTSQAPGPTVNQPQVNQDQIIQQALMRAFLGGT